MATKSCGLLLLLAAVSVSGAPMLFVDNTTISSMDTRLHFRMNTPVKGPRVIVPDKPWESWAVFAYNHVLQVAQGEHRMYYDCIEGTGVPPGVDALSHRRICLATSADGLTWTKPALGIFSRNGSTANNILLEDSGVSVFEDLNPEATQDQKWKMVCSTAVYASPDGLHWTKLPFASLAEDDTKPTGYWDPAIQKYVISVRRDVSGSRTIGRCETSNFSDWEEESRGGCPVVFGVDAVDPPGVDVYTNAWTPYPSIADVAVHLYFPSMYRHFGSEPFGFGNDGLLDIRIVTSRDGGRTRNLTYPPCANGRSPFVTLGVNRCSAGSPTAAKGWCSPTSGAEAKTSFDTSAMYMASGWLPSSDGQSVYLYSSGQPFTHGGDSANQTWKTNSGIRVLTLRRDGFVSIDAPYHFYAALDQYPTLQTAEMIVPALTCPSNQSVALTVNVVTSVVGFVAVEVQLAGAPIQGFELASSDKAVGNLLGMAVTWGGRARWSLDALVGKSVSFRLAMADCSLYSLEFACATA